ncbi:hypothetical protein OBBRIDRAFT_889349 [Obba rivulosa]|uniref:Heterokaryon incompatibility domain-containing protein n=1 Tax=Obba rivulosa TaxID=1052685 RepID=A0A8E2AWQ5_9APHY|nr:hypothetical protein OBBRIDRAFT_889349 [Obba rivulosa]
MLRKICKDIAQCIWDAASWFFSWLARLIPRDIPQCILSSRNRQPKGSRTHTSAVHLTNIDHHVPPDHIALNIGEERTAVEHVIRSDSRTSPLVSDGPEIHADDNYVVIHPFVRSAFTAGQTIYFPEVYSDPVEKFKAEFRDRLHDLTTHMAGMSQFTDQPELVSFLQFVCSGLSRLGILELPNIELNSEGPRRIQASLAISCQASLDLFEKLCPVATPDIRAWPPMDETMAHSVTELIDHQTETIMLFCELFNILAKRYAGSARHTQLSKLVSVDTRFATIWNLESTSGSTSRFVLWRYREPRQAIHTATEPSRAQKSLYSFSVITSKESVWLGCNHDGFELCSFSNYIKARQSSGRLSNREKAALLQSLLTFGLLEDVVQRTIPEYLLLEKGPTGDLVMTTCNLYSIIHEWVESILALKGSDIEAYRRRSNDTWVTLCTACAKLGVDVVNAHGPFREAGLSPEDITAIARTIGVIGEAVTAASNVLDIPDRIPLNWTLTEWDREMVVDGWCPSMVTKLSRSTSSLEYASLLKPFIPGGPERDSHSRCTEKVCMMNTIDTSMYSNQHVTETCRCKYSKPSVDDVLTTLSNNQIPLITLGNAHCHGDGPMQLLCTTSDSVQGYVAISHVWSDGLGSTTEAGLPTCQVRRLASLVYQLVPGGAFWLDALCIPAQQDMRDRAIGLMARTYQEADVVLVLDSGIQSCSVQAPLKERLVRIVTSGWMQRMWTLQEALLAKNLTFKFADGITLMGEILSSCTGLTYDPAVQFLLKESQQLTGLFVREQVFKFGNVSCALQFRTTSKPRDETLAIAGLFDVDAYELTQTAPAERMRTLLLRIRDIPSDVLFLEGPKLSGPGFKWAPASFMLSAGGGVNLAKCDAICTEEGLLATRSAIRFDQTTLRSGEPWWLRGLEDYTYLISAGPALGEYTCNAFLPRDKWIVGSMILAVAVLIKDEVNGADDPDSRLACEYVGHVFLSPTRFGTDDIGGGIIAVQETRALNLCIT